VGNSQRELGSRKRGAEGGEIETPKASRGEGSRKSGERKPSPVDYGVWGASYAPPTPKTGFGAF